MKEGGLAPGLQVLAQQVDDDVGAGDGLLDLIDPANRHVVEVDGTEVRHWPQVPCIDLVTPVRDEHACTHRTQPAADVAAKEAGRAEDGDRGASNRRATARRLERAERLQ